MDIRIVFCFNPHAGQQQRLQFADGATNVLAHSLQEGSHVVLSGAALIIQESAFGAEAKPKNRPKSRP